VRPLRDKQGRLCFKVKVVTLLYGPKTFLRGRARMFFRPDNRQACDKIVQEG